MCGISLCPVRKWKEGKKEGEREEGGWEGRKEGPKRQTPIKYKRTHTGSRQDPEQPDRGFRLNNVMPPSREQAL